MHKKSNKTYHTSFCKTLNLYFHIYPIKKSFRFYADFPIVRFRSDFGVGTFTKALLFAIIYIFQNNLYKMNFFRRRLFRQFIG